jgi:hypothetical protein
VSIVQFPTSLPSPEQLDLARLKLVELTNNLAADLLAHCNELMKTTNAPEFTVIVRKTEAKLAEANAGWSAMSTAIRDSWHI